MTSINYFQGLCALIQGLSEFATANIKDFDSLGFDRVWKPIG